MTEKKQTLEQHRQAAHQLIDQLFVELEHEDGVPVDRVQVQMRKEIHDGVHHATGVMAVVEYRWPKVMPPAGKQFLIQDRSGRTFTLAENSPEKIQAMVKAMMKVSTMEAQDAVGMMERGEAFATDRDIDEIVRITGLHFTQCPTANAPTNPKVEALTPEKKAEIEEAMTQLSSLPDSMKQAPTPEQEDEQAFIKAGLSKLAAEAADRAEPTEEPTTTQGPPES